MSVTFNYKVPFRTMLTRTIIFHLFMNESWAKPFNIMTTLGSHWQWLWTDCSNLKYKKKKTKKQAFKYEICLPLWWYPQASYLRPHLKKIKYMILRWVIHVEFLTNWLLCLSSCMCMQAQSTVYIAYMPYLFFRHHSSISKTKWKFSIIMYGSALFIWNLLLDIPLFHVFSQTGNCWQQLPAPYKRP